MRILNHNIGKFLLLITLLSCSNDDDLRGSGNLISEIRDVASFTKIKNPTSINVSISEGSAQMVEVSADDNIIEGVKTTVQNGVLKVDLSQGNYIEVTITVSITIPNLEDLKNTGSGNMTVSGFQNLTNLTMDNEGSGSVIINGSDIDLSLNNSGSGNYKGFGFTVNKCTVNNSGSGNCEVNCADALNGSNSSSGSIFYKGSPVIDISNTRSGELVDSN